jgi:hypothetical protein
VVNFLQAICSWYRLLLLLRTFLCVAPWQGSARIPIVWTQYTKKIYHLTLSSGIQVTCDEFALLCSKRWILLLVESASVDHPDLFPHTSVPSFDRYLVCVGRPAALASGLIKPTCTLCLNLLFGFVDQGMSFASPQSTAMQSEGSIWFKPPN